MTGYKLVKEVKLYKSQFDDFVTQMTHSNNLMDRTSMDLDGLLFRAQYMVKHDRDLDKLDEIKRRFDEKSLELQTMFGNFLYDFICTIIRIPAPYKLDDLTDVLVQDVKIDPAYVTFKIVVISPSEEFLKYIDSRIDSGTIFNMFPDKYFRFFTDSYNDGVAKAYPELFENRHVEGEESADGDIFCHNFTFQVTEECSLNCIYCYQCNKSQMRMDFDTAKQFIDHLLNDDYGYINRYNSPAIIIEFIGGEPLLETNLIRQIYEYFLERCYDLNHPWFTMHRLSICSNGMQYFNPEVQDFFKGYHHRISFNISIDGNKELHDACRIQPNGEGSYDIDMMALKHYTEHFNGERNSKMTLAPSNIHYLFDSVVDFISQGMKIINLNCVFEEGWTPETAREEYYQLKKLADYLVDNDLHNLYIAIFNERQEDLSDKYRDQPYCGGSGAMLAMRPNGQFYPCIRYMPSSVGDHVPDLCIGSVQTGMVGRKEGSEILKMMDNITRRSLSNDICFDCPIGNDCAYCLALGHATFGTPNKRPTFACIQMFAEALANVYYWNRLILKHPEFDLDVRMNNVPDEWSLLVIDQDELDELKLLENAAIITVIEHRSKPTQ